MSQPGAVVVALGGDEHLRLVFEAAEGLGVDDPVAVALKRRAQRAVGLWPGALSRVGAGPELPHVLVLPRVDPFLQRTGQRRRAIDWHGGHLHRRISARVEPIAPVRLAAGSGRCSEVNVSVMVERRGDRPLDLAKSRLRSARSVGQWPAHRLDHEPVRRLGEREAPSLAGRAHDASRGAREARERAHELSSGANPAASASFSRNASAVASPAAPSTVENGETPLGGSCPSSSER